MHEHRLPREQREVIARGLAALRSNLREFYEGTRQERDALRAILRGLRWVRAYKDGELRD